MFQKADCIVTPSQGHTWSIRSAIRFISLCSSECVHTNPAFGGLESSEKRRHWELWPIHLQPPPAVCERVLGVCWNLQYVGVWRGAS